MTPPAHIALIGCGFTGTSSFFQLVDQYPVQEITIFEATGDFGPGYPYRSEECRDYLMNNTTDTMCLVPSNRRAFLDWLRGRPALAPDPDPRGYLPRAVFGVFLKDVFDATRTAAAVKGIKVHLVPFEATALREDADGRVHIAWAEGETVADIAILSTGRCPDIDAYPQPPAGATARYITNHVLSSELDRVPLDATVHLLGASLSAYDVINRLFSPDTGCHFLRGADGTLTFQEPGPNRRRVVLCSRSGRLKSMQTRTPVEIRRTRLTLQSLRDAARGRGVTLDDLFHVIGQEAQNHGAPIDWEAAVDPYGGSRSSAELNTRAEAFLEAAITAASGPGSGNFLADLYADAMIDVWDAFAERLLTADAERSYRSKMETAALCYMAPCPIRTGEKLLALHRAGRLTVIKGVGDVRLARDAASYDIVHDFGTEAAEFLVNTAGMVDRDVQSAAQPALIRSLVAEGLLLPYERDGVAMKGAAVHMDSFLAKGARSIYIANMLLWGPGIFTSSAFMMSTIAGRILQAVFQDRRPQSKSPC